MGAGRAGHSWPPGQPLALSYQQPMCVLGKVKSRIGCFLFEGGGAAGSGHPGPVLSGGGLKEPSVLDGGQVTDVALYQLCDSDSFPQLRKVQLLGVQQGVSLAGVWVCLGQVVAGGAEVWAAAASCCKSWMGGRFL